MDAPSTDRTIIGDQKRPRFHLCFSVRNPLSSKSDIYKATVKLCGISTPIITQKFYSLHNIRLTEEDEEEIQILMKKLAKITDLGPREKYKEPILESHRYGWFQEKFIEKNPKVDRIDFPKHVSEMVKIQNLFAESKAKNHSYGQIIKALTREIDYFVSNGTKLTHPSVTQQSILFLDPINALIWLIFI